MNWIFGRITDISEKEYDEIYASLSKSRKARIDRMKIEDDRKRSLMATHLAKELLRQIGKDAGEIAAGENGKPYITGESLHISISHSDDAVVCAISEDAVGIDVEKICPKATGLIDRVCNAKEKEYVQTSDANTTSRNFMIIWTAKEAFYKKNSALNLKITEIDTFSFEKQTFFIDDYIITIV